MLSVHAGLGGVPYAVASVFLHFGIFGVLKLIASSLPIQVLIVSVLGVGTKRRSLEANAGDAPSVEAPEANAKTAAG